MSDVFLTAGTLFTLLDAQYKLIREPTDVDVKVFQVSKSILKYRELVHCTILEKRTRRDRNIRLG